MSQARLLRDQGHLAQAQDTLGAVHGRFTEGFASRDLLAAAELLQQLASSEAG
jgi:hypothetical protein